MNPRELQLKQCAAPERETVAWFLPGGDAGSWLEELCGWAVAHERLKLFIVPRSAREHTAGGLLVLLPAGCVVPQSARGLPLGEIESRLFLPVDAELSPPVTTAEVREMCRADITLFHPGIGAIAFEEGDCRRIWDLLERPAATSATDWNSAVEGAALSSRLTGVTLLALPQGGDIFGDASKEIGSDPIAELPPPADEPRSSPAGRIRRAVTGMAAAAIGKIFSLLPKNSPRRTWVNDVLDWAASKLTSVSQELEQLRHRELHRLLDMLDSDPERGLRHALPLDGPPGRGRTAPSAQLGPRDTRFDLARVGGGRPGDHWDVPAELRRKLLARYREIALSEQRMGRFQRAAYIHAELLGDLSAAATVLKEGRYFAEAAAVYRDHLRQPRAAAECFVAGGFFAEAITIFEKEGALLDVGDLHRKLGDEPAAEIAFRKAVGMRITASDFTGAATLLEERLRAPDEALTLLASGWPNSPQATQCLAAEFALLGKLGRHEAAQRRLGALSAEATPQRRALDLADVLRAVRGTYPDCTVRPIAADLARVKVSEGLSGGNEDSVRRGARILKDLAPEDRLLGRDLSRFVAARLGALAKTAPPPAPQRKCGTARIAEPVIVRKFQLANSGAVSAVRRCGRNFLAVVRQRQGSLFVRGNWSGIVNAVAWPGGHALQKSLKLVLDEHAVSPAHAVPFAIPLPDRIPSTLATTGAFPEPVSLAVPSWMPAGVAAIATSAGQWWLLRASAGEFILECRTEDGRLNGSTALTPWLGEITAPVEFISLLALESHVWIALDRHLFLFKDTRDPHRWTCDSPIIGLEPSAPFLPRAALARCTQGAIVFWADQLEAEPPVLAKDLSFPHATFLSNGTLVILSNVTIPGGFPGQVIALDRRGVHGSRDFIWPGPQPAALVATDSRNGFAIITHSGEALVHHIPPITS